MVTRKPCGPRRTGAQTVETAVVMIWLMVFVMGVFEYGRLLMDWNILNNAAREGCRYALANNTASTITSDTTATVIGGTINGTPVAGYMAGENVNFTGFTVTVTGTHNGVSTAINNLAAGDMVTVSVSGTYKFLNIIPIIAMPSAFTMTTSVTMGCEGGT